MNEDYAEKFIKSAYDKALSEKQTFSEEMQKHIESELQRMIDEYVELHTNDKPAET